MTGHYPQIAVANSTASNNSSASNANSTATNSWDPTEHFGSLKVAPKLLYVRKIQSITFSSLSFYFLFFFLCCI